jgi:N6-adenosine-specific RNA methylase IME4
VSKKKFDVIVADPPWPFKDSLKMSNVKRGAQAQYDTMTMQEIRELPVQKACNKDGAVLCLWVPSSLLQEGLDTMKAWGFQHKQTYVWVKTKIEPLVEFKKLMKLATKLLATLDKDQRTFGLSEVRTIFRYAYDMSQREFNYQTMLGFGMGRLFRQTHELCLIGTNNNAIYKKLANKSRRSVCLVENLRHSAKPDDLQNSLELMFPTARKLELFARRIRPGWTCLGNEIDGLDIRDALSKL